MPPPRRPADETERLAALQASGVLETGADPKLDAIVRRAALEFGAPIAAVTLLDGTHQHFKASVGLDAPRVARDEAFCGYAILEPDPLVVLDAHADGRFADNPLVLGQPGIRFYAGAVVFGPGKQPFGALCVIDTAGRPAFEEAAVQSLRAMADEVSTLLSEHPGKTRPPR